MYEQDWVLSMVDEGDEVNAVLEKNRVLVDSGCATTVLKKGQFQAPLTKTTARFNLSNISGGAIPQFGHQEPKGRMQSGRVGSLPGTMVDAKRSALAVSESVDAGNSVVFTPHGAFMTKTFVPIPSDAEMFEREGKLWYLPFEEVCEDAAGLVQPICPVEVDGDADNAELPAERESWGAEEHVSDWDQMWIEAQRDGRVLPFYRLVRKDKQAWRFRFVRRDDPGTAESLLRRITVDTRTQEVLDDTFKAQVDIDFNWRGLLPRAPIGITTKFFFESGGAPSALSDVEPRRKPDTGVQIPILPSEEERERHYVDHCPFAAWCEWCVAGRSRGTPHKVVTSWSDGLCHADYTFWSHVGYNYARENTPGAACSLTVRHMQSGAVCASVAVRKGAWPFLVALVADWAVRLRKDLITIRGDPEPSLLKLLEAVREAIVNKGGQCKIEHGATGSHQSIGGAEVTHDILAGFCRTLAGMLENHTGLRIEPQSRLFVWLLRHAAALLTTRHIQKHGLTAYKILNGNDSSAKYLIFGEAALFKVAEVRHQGKLLPRWRRGIWVGVRDSDQSHIFLNDQGWNSAREVSRLPIENRWDRQLLDRCAGLPWSRHEGAALAAAPPERSVPVGIGVPVPSSSAEPQAADAQPESATTHLDDQSESAQDDGSSIPPLPPPEAFELLVLGAEPKAPNELRMSSCQAPLARVACPWMRKRMRGLAHGKEILIRLVRSQSAGGPPKRC